MNTYISILRGINVSGKNKIKMADLRTMYEGLGFESVTSYIQSGNVLFRFEDTTPEVLAQRIKQQITETFGYDVPVLVLTRDYLEQVASSHPFIETGEEPLSQLLVTFLATEPDPALVAAVNEFEYKEDQFLIGNKAIHIYCPGGYGKTKLSNVFFERKLKVTATTRNWKSVNKLLELGKEMS